MKLYLLTNPWEKGAGTDTYDKIIVAAPTRYEARRIHPSLNGQFHNECDTSGTWCDVDVVNVTCIGTARRGTKKGVIVASFNAG